MGIQLDEWKFFLLRCWQKPNYCIPVSGLIRCGTPEAIILIILLSFDTLKSLRKITDA
jgi:hypothetical protein